MSEAVPAADQATASAAQEPAAPAASGIRVERTGIRRGVAYSPHGGKVEFGPADSEGTFTPGELLKVALAACGVMSSDGVIRRVLGDDYRVTATVDATSDDTIDRYDAFAETFALDLSGLDDAARTRLETTVERAIDRSCTVRNTLKVATPVTMQLTQRQA